MMNDLGTLVYAMRLLCHGGLLLALPELLYFSTKPRAMVIIKPFCAAIQGGMPCYYGLADDGRNNFFTLSAWKMKEPGASDEMCKSDELRVQSKKPYRRKDRQYVLANQGHGGTRA